MAEDLERKEMALANYLDPYPYICCEEQSARNLGLTQKQCAEYVAAFERGYIQQEAERRAQQRDNVNFDAEAYIRQSNELENFLPRPAGMEPRKGINFPLADFATELRREITEWLKI